MPENKSLIFKSLLVFYLTILVYFIASFFTGSRTWGVDFWGYYPLWVRVCLLGTTLIIGLLIHLKLSSYKKIETKADDTTNEKKGEYWIFISATVLLGLLFYYFKIRTHFHGDGYTLIGLLAEDNPLIKNRELGESLIHVWVKYLTGLQGNQGALVSYQVVSISAGILFVLSTIWFAYRSYDTFKERIIFTLGMFSGGYLLLFFGYVENYSFFVLSAVIFTYICILILNRKISRYWVLPSLGLTILFHIFGVILIPGAIYAMIAGTRLGNRIKSISKPTLYLIGTILMVGIGYFSFYIYSDISFFRLSILPIISDKFTADSYTMFSINHLLDIINLLFVLMPGIGLLILFLISYIKEKQNWDRDFIFLIILSLSGLAATLIFDPKIGMPRDWDLFSFTGLPLCLIIFYYAIRKINEHRGYYLSIMIYSILLGIISLSARITNINIPSIAEKQFKDYLYLDHSKGRYAWVILTNYYMNNGDTLTANNVYLEREKVLPEIVKLNQARDFLAENKLDTAIVLLDQILGVDGSYGDAWTSLGECYMFKKNYVKAIEYFKIAIVLHPYKHPDLNNIGYMLTKLGRYEEAEKYLLRAFKIKPSLGQIAANLAALYRAKLDKDNYEKFITIAINDPAIPTNIIKEYGDYCISQMRYEEAAEVYQRALSRGLDTNHVINTMNKYPALKQYIHFKN